MELNAVWLFFIVAFVVEVNRSEVGIGQNERHHHRHRHGQQRRVVEETDSTAFQENDNTDAVNEPKVRQFFSNLCQDRLNEQIVYEFQASQIYLSMSTFLSRWDVALPGFAKKFRQMSDEEREHGIKLLEYINKRGGTAKLPLSVDISEYRSQIESNHWGDIMNVMLTALKLERLVNHRLVDFVRTCRDTQNYHMEDYIDSVFIPEQVESIHELGKMITELKMIGNSHLDNYGLYQYDKQLK